MIEDSFTFTDDGGVNIFVYKWIPNSEKDVKGVVQIAHGMAETAARYKRFAESLTKLGYAVYANDHRGHGRTAQSLEKVGILGEDGFNWMVRDMKKLNDIIKTQYPGIPVILFGHSMGSMLAQKYIALHGDTIRGVILSGTSGRQGIMLDLGLIIAKSEIKKIGRDGKSQKMNNLTFKSYNNAFQPVRTDFDWLSRDNAEVDKYIKDPYCGGIFSAGFFYDFLKGLKEIHKKELMAKIPQDLPIFVVSGEMDPVGKNCSTVRSLIGEYKKLGIKDVTYKFYKGGRHEMLNEINRDEVTHDIASWLETHMKDA